MRRRAMPIFRPRSHPRSGFTLIELLVVIAVIATLAGLLIPAVTLIKSKSNDVKCKNNLRQLGIAMMVYRDDRDDTFPGQLSEMFNFKSTLGLAGLEKKLLVCPRDQSRGTDVTMNREESLFKFTLSELHNSNSSYLYQTGTHKLNDVTYDWFTFKTSTGTGSLHSIGKLMVANSNSWADGKRNQLAVGNLNPNPILPEDRGYPFSPSLFPIISCFYHNAWTKVNMRSQRRAFSVTFDGNIFDHIPYWEHQVNPDIPLPPP